MLITFFKVALVKSHSFVQVTTNCVPWTGYVWVNSNSNNNNNINNINNNNYIFCLFLTERIFGWATFFYTLS